MPPLTINIHSSQKFELGQQKNSKSIVVHPRILIVDAGRFPAFAAARLGFRRRGTKSLLLPGRKGSFEREMANRN
jgi:hypothetical protein